MSGTWSDERVYNNRVLQQHEELYQGSEDYEDSKMSTSSSGGAKKFTWNQNIYRLSM